MFNSYTHFPIQIGDELLVKFCRTVEDLYGSSMITPNMHLHCHLCECILDFGPVYGFWCFSFERYNGILGALHVNNHQIKVQLMRKFIERQQLGSMSWPWEFETFEDMLVSADKGTLAWTKKPRLTPAEYRQSIQLKVGTGQELHHLSFFDKHFIQVLSPVKEIYMSDGGVEALRTMYAFLHKEDSIVYVPKLSHKFSSLMLYDQKLDSQYSRSERSACILARWYGANGLNTTSVDLRPGEFVHMSCGEGSYNITCLTNPWLLLASLLILTGINLSYQFSALKCILKQTCSFPFLNLMVWLQHGFATISYDRNFNLYWFFLVNLSSEI